MEKLSRREQKEKTRLGLIDEALSLFARRGITATTTADVAKALEVSHGTVFMHFPTRDDLVLAVIDTFGARLSAELGRRLNNEMPLRALLRAHLSVLAEFEDFYLRLVTESHALPSALRAQVYSMNASLSYRFHRAAREQMKTGEFKQLAQVPFFSTWMALVQYHVMNRDLLCEDTPILKHKGEEILRLFTQLIKENP